MHDPQTVAFEIPSPFKVKKPVSTFFPKGFYRKTLITIWHVDPETDGTDDSCGWFMRPRHGDQRKLEAIQKEFDYYFRNNLWFDDSTTRQPKMSTLAIALEIYHHATWVYFDKNRRRQSRFMRKHLVDILHFAENPIDSLNVIIENTYDAKGTERVNELLGLASTVFADICRKERPWWKHPRWHFWHWKISFHFKSE